MWETILIGLLVVVFISWLKSSVRPSNFPPGPINLPFVGSAMILDVRNLTKSFSTLKKKYGDIFSIYVGSTPVVVLNSYQVIKEAFDRHEFSGRPGNFSGTFFQKGRTGISTTEGKHWKIQRDFLENYLNNLTGAGHKAVEEVILDETTDLKSEFSKHEGEPVSVSYKTNISILNVLWNVVCGRKLHSQQQEFQTVYECIDKITQFMSRAAIFSFLPVLTKLLPESITCIERGRYYRNRFHEISEKWIQEHRQDYRGNRTGDLQDAYIKRINQGDDTFSEQGLAAMLREIFIIGAESESVMMRWVFRILSCNPQVQKKIQAELEAVVGPKTEVKWENKDDLPYTMAVIKEIQRYADIAPTGLMHKTMCDVKIGEYTLPEVILFKPCIKPISLLSFFKLLFLIQVPDIVFKILKKPSNSVKTSFCTKRLICLPG
ncbi:cytochrome P450 2C27 [Eurytemora carolleeae]|uniref:cytochrome P450 2C27 n=1 Tax=Eurytemora carolleeae TaxID=1294199 RepID=UPI000C7700C7|nr:cytochrome P450 2C27 [Eurytemora carolleeae]|eukprot:XP_023333086.1 cytochrome P450 2C27-like [Eurytemora affinis]